MLLSSKAFQVQSINLYSIGANMFQVTSCSKNVRTLRKLSSSATWAMHYVYCILLYRRSIACYQSRVESHYVCLDWMAKQVWLGGKSSHPERILLKSCNSADKNSARDRIWRLLIASNCIQHKSYMVHPTQTWRLGRDSIITKPDDTRISFVLYPSVQKKTHFSVEFG